MATRHLPTVLALGMLLAPLTLSHDAVAQAARDSTPPRTRVALIKGDDWRGAAWVLLATGLVATQDRNVDSFFADSARRANETYKSISGKLTTIHERSMLTYSLVAYVGGRIFRNAPVADGGLHIAEAVAAGTVIGSFLKSTTGRARPRAANGDPFDFKPFKGYTAGEYRSFPSLHEIGSFAAASALTAEVARHSPHAGRIVGVLAYGTAGAVGVSRMYSAEHWASDVLMGTAMGIFLGKRVVDHAHSGPPSKVDRFFLGPLAASETRVGITLYDRDF